MEYRWERVRDARKRLNILQPHEAFMAIPPHLVPGLIKVAIGMDEVRPLIREMLGTELPRGAGDELRFDDLALPEGRRIASCDGCTYYPEARCHEDVACPGGTACQGDHGDRLDSMMEKDIDTDDPKLRARYSDEEIQAITSAQVRIGKLHGALGRMLPTLHARELALIRKQIAEEETLRQMAP